MTRPWALSCIFALICLMTGSYLHADELLEAFSIRELASDSQGQTRIEGLWMGQKYLLTPNDEDVLTRDESGDSDPSLLMMAIFNLIYWTHHTVTDGRDSLRQIQEVLKRVETHFLTALPQDTALEILTLSCAAKSNRNCLGAVLSLSKEFVRVRSLALSHLALLEADPRVAYAMVQEALNTTPTSRSVQKLAELLSLQIAAGVVQSYRNALFDSSIWKNLSIEHGAGPGDFTYKDVFWEVLENSTNALVRLPLFSDHLLSEWADQVAYLDDLRRDIEAARFKLESSHLLFHEIDDQSAFFQTPFAKDIAQNHLFTRLRNASGHNEALPDLKFQFDFDPKTEFVQYGWGHLAVSQISILNVWMIWRGPAAVRAFGKSRAGIWTIKSFRLQGVVNAAARLPKPLDSLALLMVFETADGCTLRWGYTIYTGVTKIYAEN